MINIMILMAHKRKGHGAMFVCPVSCRVSHLTAILFVDKKDIIHMHLDLKDSTKEAHLALQ